MLRSPIGRDFRDYPNDPDDYELLEELGKGASATVSDERPSTCSLSSSRLSKDWAESGACKTS